MPSIVWTHFKKKIPITGIIADLDVAHVFNVTYVDCSFFVVLHLMLRPQGHKKRRSLSIHIRVMSLDGAALGKARLVSVIVLSPSDTRTDAS
jgi:hypothetical protein